MYVVDPFYELTGVLEPVRRRRHLIGYKDRCKRQMSAENYDMVAAPVQPS